MPRIVPKEELLEMAGTELGPSPWLKIEQDRIQLFADATDDHQYIHLDAEKAAQTPFGATIAHGFLSLSLLTHLSKEIAVVPEGMVMGINYGLNKVRFLQPVKVDSEIRLRSKILSVREKKPGHILVTAKATVEIQDEEKPALLAETLSMYVVGG